MTAKVVIGFFVALKRRSDPTKSRFFTLKKTIYDVLSLFYYHFLYQPITITFDGDVIDTIIQVT